MLIAKIISTLSLTLIILFWFYTIPDPKKDYIKNMTSARMIFVYLLATIIYLQIFGVLYLPLITHNYYWIFFTSGFILTLFGLIFGIWAKITMKNNWNTPGTINPNRQKNLITSGPFAYSRNPIYFGLTIYFLGVHLLLNSFIILFIIPIFLFIHMNILKEEMLLEKNFKKEYLNYKKQVPRYFLK